MKRLIAEGCQNIFQICRCFRKNERGQIHLPEYTMLEWYTVGGTYLDLMEQCQDLLRHVALECGTSESLIFQNERIDLSGSWQRLTLEKAFSRYTEKTLEAALRQGRFDEVFSFEVEPKLGRGKPTFIMDYPASMAALARLKPGDGCVAERFELYIAGMELANGFSELTDSVQQRLRFETELAARKNNGKKVTPMPEKFLQELSHMPETAGIALGMDRLVMLFTDRPAIDNVVAFTPESL